MALLAKYWLHMSQLLWFVCKSSDRFHISVIFNYLLLTFLKHTPKQNVRTTPIYQWPNSKNHQFFCISISPNSLSFFLKYYIGNVRYTIVWDILMHTSKNNIFLYTTMPLSTQNKINSSSFGLIPNLYLNFSNKIVYIRFIQISI